MALDDLEVARMVCDLDVPRAEVTRLVAGMTPAKLARVVALLRPVELQLGLSKMRVRRRPSIQAHVTNRIDDPLLIAADAATAVAFGFRELETTVPVPGDAACVAVALLIGSQVGRDGALVQCSVEEAIELELGMRGLTSYAETVSLYGTEPMFVDGDDTPWSKALLCSACASRGLKMRVTSGAGSEVLMGEAERCSMLFIFSGYGSIPKYDNTFAISSFNAEDLGDYLALQRDWGVDGGLRPQTAEPLAEVRRRGASAAPGLRGPGPRPVRRVARGGRGPGGGLARPAAGRGRAARRGLRRADRGDDPARPHGGARGGRRARALPALGRGGAHDRPYAGGRRGRADLRTRPRRAAQAGDLRRR